MARGGAFKTLGCGTLRGIIGAGGVHLEKLSLRRHKGDLSSLYVMDGTSCLCVKVVLQVNGYDEEDTRMYLADRVLLLKVNGEGAKKKDR